MALGREGSVGGPWRSTGARVRFVEIEFRRSLGDETRARVNELEAHDDRGRLCLDD